MRGRADELATAFQNAAVDLEAPFIVRGATDDFERLQKEWTSDKLRGKKFKDVRVRYLEPKMARVAMQQGGQAKLAGDAAVEIKCQGDVSQYYTPEELRPPRRPRTAAVEA